ncbi:MAG: hypothetical protein ACJAYU_004761 [Bradymonadia bacterium]|jgi:hypothetical protein
MRIPAAIQAPASVRLAEIVDGAGMPPLVAEAELEL